jgi:NADP-dependent 3-hydroxy acid dehydrogenase YdfG
VRSPKVFGRIDVIVNNAGVMPLSPLRALKVAEWDQMVDVNNKGVLNGIAAVLAMKEFRRIAIEPDAIGRAVRYAMNRAC